MTWEIPHWEAERPWLWGVCYRVVGHAADADDLVQETWLRASAHPPPDLDRPLRPWLATIAIRLARDLLRARRRRAYIGPWLPSPVPEAGADEAVADTEAASYALLVAMETLTPSQRAVYVLREHAEWPVADTAVALGMSETSVKVTLHRARAALARVDGLGAPTASRDEAQAALLRFLAALGSGDPAQVRALLTDTVVARSDGAGEYAAARVPIVGSQRVASTYLALAREQGAPDRHRIGRFNGLWGVVAEVDRPLARWAPRWILLVDVGADGRIRALYSAVAPAKLVAVPALG